MTPRYIVVFTQATGVLKWFLKHGFGHVYLILRDDPNWIKIDPLWSRLSIEILPICSRDTHYQTLINKLHEIGAQTITLRRVRKVGAGRINFARYALCVGAIQYILGTAYWAFTPWQLYKKLSKEVKNGKTERKRGREANA